MLTDNRSTPEITGRSLPQTLPVLDQEILYAGGMCAIDATDELRMASDAVGLRVIGRTPRYVNNADDGRTANAEHGIFRYANSATAPLPRSAIGEPCYVEDDATVAADATAYIAAGLVYDVTTSGVWVDQRPTALAAARARALPVVIHETTTARTVTAAEAFTANHLFRCDNAAGFTLTLPPAVAGMRIAVQRLSATAGHDLTVQAAAGDTVLGSDAGKRITNTTDARSHVLYLRAVDDTAWILDHPVAPDLDAWAIDNT